MKKCFTVLLILAAPMAVALSLLIGPAGLGIPEGAILTLRMHRIVAGLVVGAGLACSGVVLQALLRNPLAEPYVLGVSGGAGLGASVAIICGLVKFSEFALPATAFLFAIAALILVYKLASRDGTPSVYSLILSGVIVSTMCSAVMMYLVSTSSDAQLRSVTMWMLGSLQITSRGLLQLDSIVIILAIAAAWAMSREFNALTLGREMAHHVGISIKTAIGAGLVLATLLGATAVTLAGLIGFVGLIVPHVVRSLIGPDHRRLIPASALAGGAFVVFCDAIARSILAGQEIPIGVITAILGGPFFLAILRSRRRSGWIE